MALLDYGEQELAYLKKKDKKLGALIDRVGYLECELNADPFTAIVHSIANQQISNKAADTVCRRITETFGTLTPHALADVPPEEIQKVGISMKKAHYIKGACDAALSGQLDFAKLHELSDDEIRAMMLPLKGIGEWTVEMFLIFTLGRKNVVSWGDYAIRKGMCILYGHRELDRAKFERYKKRYSPYGSIASLYLWRQLQ